MMRVSVCFAMGISRKMEVLVLSLLNHEISGWRRVSTCDIIRIEIVMVCRYAITSEVKAR